MAVLFTQAAQRGGANPVLQAAQGIARKNHSLPGSALPLAGVKKGHNFRAWQNRIDRMTADFVVCSKDSTVMAVIELTTQHMSLIDAVTQTLRRTKRLKPLEFA